MFSNHAVVSNSCGSVSAVAVIDDKEKKSTRLRVLNLQGEKRCDCLNENLCSLSK